MAEAAAIKAVADSCIGSLISLTTKSGMRYEGSKLHVNAQECTIALQNVKSFGTEGRRPAFVVAPSDKIYNYVVFYGSDMNDLRVISSPSSPPSFPSLLDDPAIIESRDSLPPPMHTGLASTGAVKAPNHQQFTSAITKEAASIPGLLPVPILSTSVNKVVSRKFVIPSDLLPIPNVAASLSVQSSPGQFATPQSGFSPVPGPLTPNYPHGLLSGVMMGSAKNVSAIPVSLSYPDFWTHLHLNTCRTQWQKRRSDHQIISIIRTSTIWEYNVEEAKMLLSPSLWD
ncbi:PREDICTED: decapping 5-like protein [Ipomoea nil]|uniref:decapping 5-like protein n=1 Tax=Ipomoea nil TaxID=35883 RepID=UPI000900C255|nr:PREDICTED: decapping 5-like protein [Ipomoea nil]